MNFHCRSTKQPTASFVQENLV